jgi:hypothetical protein
MAAFMGSMFFAGLLLAPAIILTAVAGEKKVEATAQKETLKPGNSEVKKSRKPSKDGVSTRDLKYPSTQTKSTTQGFQDQIVFQSTSTPSTTSTTSQPTTQK